MSGPGIISLHRHIQQAQARDTFRSLARERDALAMQLRQRDMVMWLLLRRHGPQRIDVDEFSMIPTDAMTGCDELEGGTTLVFRAGPEPAVAPITEPTPDAAASAVMAGEVNQPTPEVAP